MKNSSFVCPHCGETISANAEVCPYCGSDENTGWSENTYLDGIAVDDDFDYEESYTDEFTGGKKHRIKMGQIVTGVILLLLFLLAIIKSLLK